ncbi:hypothetical protein VNO77_30566 [Canavalia gladiata]|uniref:Uncharacterized protein n=1 Tax=Canavalia gladiata TaxID=3824 RepID=A0AAN9Q7B3_CANGL
MCDNNQILKPPPKMVTEAVQNQEEERGDRALVVNFAFQLPHMPDESVSTINGQDRFLHLVKSLNPKLITVMEQDVNTTTTPFSPRLVEAYNYCSAVFESLDFTLLRGGQGRTNVERQYLARDLVNDVACLTQVQWVLSIGLYKTRWEVDMYLRLIEDHGEAAESNQRERSIFASNAKYDTVLTNMTGLELTEQEPSLALWLELLQADLCPIWVLDCILTVSKQKIHIPIWSHHASYMQFNANGQATICKRNQITEETRFELIFKQALHIEVCMPKRGYSRCIYVFSFSQSSSSQNKFLLTHAIYNHKENQNIY